MGANRIPIEVMQPIGRTLIGATLTGLALTTLAVLAACRDTPGIDGATVPPLGSETAPPACEPLCNRLVELCSYAPTDCVAQCADYDDAHRACKGQATSCREALETCANEEVDGGDEDGEAPTDEAAAPEEDGATADDAGDAEPLPGDAANDG